MEVILFALKVISIQNHHSLFSYMKCLKKSKWLNLNCKGRHIGQRKLFGYPTHVIAYIFMCQRNRQYTTEFPAMTNIVCLFNGEA